MTKPFLLIAGDNYYPGAGTDNWIARFSTKEEAKEQIYENPKDPNHYTGLGKFMIVGNNCNSFDWYEIVNLETWGMNETN